MGRIEGSTARLLLIAAGAFVVLAIAVTGDPVQVWREPPPSQERSGTGTRERDDTPVTLPTQEAVPASGRADGDLFAQIAAVLLALSLASVVFLIVTKWPRGRDRRTRRIRARQTTMDPLGSVDAPVIVVDEAAQLAALREGSPRNAIVACWLQMEDDVARAGIAQHPAETPSEYTTRVLAMTPLEPRPVAELAALYREARFSRHELDQSHRERAVAAVLEIHRELAAQAAAIAASRAAEAAAHEPALTTPRRDSAE